MEGAPIRRQEDVGGGGRQWVADVGNGSGGGVWATGAGSGDRRRGAGEGSRVFCSVGGWLEAGRGGQHDLQFVGVHVRGRGRL